jgi:hypothetical protein
MGTFSNGTEGEIYREQYCDRCIHGNDCAVWLAHEIHNYDECNNKDSILHMLIPLSNDGLGNEQCSMFHEGTPKPHPDQLDFLSEALNSGDGTYKP